MSNNKSSIIPNSFQFPNPIIDQLWYFLTPYEAMILAFAIREILGWRDRITSRSAHISLSVFVDGKKNRDGAILCNGCGLNRATVIKALTELDRCRILIKRDSDNPNLGQRYYLQDDMDKIDWARLQTRYIETLTKSRQRTSKAREVVCGTDQRQSVGQTDSGLWDRPKAVCGTDSKKPKETHKKEEYKEIWVSARDLIEGTITKPTADRHLPDCQPLSLVDDILTVSCPSTSLPWLLRLNGRISQAVSIAADRKVTVEFVEEAA